jgi:hypothetical protein
MANRTVAPIYHLALVIFHSTTCARISMNAVCPDTISIPEVKCGVVNGTNLCNGAYRNGISHVTGLSL